MDWLIPSVGYTLVGALGLTLVYWSFFHQDRRRYLGLWAAAWTAYALRYGFALWMAVASETPLLLIPNQIFALLSGVLLLAGTYEFIGRRISPRPWAVGTALGAAWILVAVFQDLPFFLLSVPTFFFLGAAFVWTGVTFLRHDPPAGIAQWVVGSAFFLWGLHKLDYPFLRPVAWFAPWGFLLGAILSLTVALGALLVHIQRARKALRASEARFRRLAENAEDLIYRYRLRPRRGFEYVSPAATRITGYTPEEHYADPDLGLKLIHPEDREILTEIHAGEVRKLSDPLTLRWVRKDGEVIWTEQKNVPIYDESGQLVAIEGIARDITARKRAERTLERYNQRLAALRNTDRAILALRPLEELAQVATGQLLELVNCDRASLTLIDAEAQVATVVAAAERSGSTGMDLGAEIPLGELEDVLEALQSGEVVYFADLREAPEGVAFWRQLRGQGFQALAVAPLIYRGELLGELNLLSRTADAFSAEDLEIAHEAADSLAIAAQNARLFSAVQERSEQVRALARRMQELEEAERKHIAHELHDRVGQDVTALSINLKVIENLLPEAIPARVRERLEESLTLIEQTASHVRYIMDDLRPAVLDDYGLPAALRWQGERFGDRTGIRVVVEAPEEGLPVDPEVEWTLFRIVSEALNNVAKHAGAEQVNIKLELDEALVQLSVEDDGIGLEASARVQEGQAGGLGIEMMRERAAALGGSITMESSRGRGTTLRVQVPR